MKLYGSLTSPFARKCRVTALEVGLSDRIDWISVSVMDETTTHPNPLKLVPSFETDSDELIVDSRTICEYLIESGNGNLARSDWGDRTLVAMADGLMDRAVSITLETRRPEKDRSNDWLDRWTAAIRATLSELERRCPDTLTPGAISLLCALGYLDFRHAELNWRDDHPDLANWYKRLSQRPSFTSTEPPA